MDEKKPETTGRLPYEKPRLRIIDLATDEVLATGCKLPSAGSGAPLLPDFCGFNNGCVMYGS